MSWAVHRPGVPVCEAVVRSDPRGQSPAPSHLASARSRLLLLFEGGLHWSEMRQCGRHLEKMQTGNWEKVRLGVCQGDTVVELLVHM